ncbi:MAG: 3-hydroxypropionyl-coenzyme A dehydratase [Candidatus Heimdallarchaeota archaeon LC_2]|nr:MAG: 3-hydroxypropionyl-coenzyme A dehydratase [Candidatus Heimdallarchaeota archaeon LC_2]
MAIVEYSKEGTFLSDTENIAKISLNRPEIMNALSLEMLEEINKALDKAENDNDIRAVVLTGNGKAFCAGVDLKAINALNEEDRKRLTTLGQSTFKRIEDFPKVVIAAINGYAFGGGLEISMACDMRVASEEAKFGTSEVKLGLIPAWGGLQRLPYLIGMSRAREMVLTGNTYGPAELEKWGLLSKVVPPDELASTAAFLASNVADNAPLALKYAKQSLNATRTLSIDEGYKLDTELQDKLNVSEDLQEGITAFLAKRKPKYSGK